MVTAVYKDKLVSVEKIFCNVSGNIRSRQIKKKLSLRINSLFNFFRTKAAFRIVGLFCSLNGQHENEYSFI